MSLLRKAAAIGVLGLGLLAAACGGSEPPVRQLGTRAVIIGIDGADWQLIDELAAEGDLPHLTRLREAGVSGPISTLSDIALSPAIWTSIATGKTADKHGIAWFLVDRADGTRVPVRSYNRKVKAIWNILAEHERRPVAVGWWASYPAEEVGDGAIVSDGLGFHGFGSTSREGENDRKTYPAGLFSRVEPLVPEDSDIDAAFARRFLRITTEEYGAEKYDPTRDAARDPANPIHLFQEYALTAQGYTAIAEELLLEPYDLMLLYYEQVDSLSHLFMKYAPPKLRWVDDAGYERYRDIVREWYRYQDELLGRLLAKIDLEQTAVFLMSDHGFKSGSRRIRSEQVVDVRKAHLDHEFHGVFLAAGPHIRKGVEISDASVLDVTPTMLHYLGFPVAEDMDGRVLGSLFEPEFRERYPVRTLPTYEDGDATPAAEIAEDFTAEELEERMRALEALGYVGGGNKPGDELPGPGSPGRGSESSPEIHNNLGRIHLGRGRLDEARAEFERALVLAPDNADALLNLGSIERVRGRVEQAEHFVKRALRVNPDSVAAIAELAEVKRDQGNLDESIRLYREALRIDDSSPGVHLGYGDSLQRAGLTDRAEKAFVSVLELDPDSFEGHYNLGVVYLRQARLDDAAERFAKALELSPRHPRVAYPLNNLGDIYLRQGDVERALGSFRRAAESAPGHFESHYNLGVLHLQRAEVDEAIGWLEQAAKLQPDSEPANASLGMAYLRKGRNQDAFKSFTLVRRLYPGNWVASLGLALLHANAQQPDQAQAYLAEALRNGGDVARAEARSYPLLRALL